MYIRRTKTGTSASGQSYYTYRLVVSERSEGKVRQKTLLNLGRYFSLPKEKWPELCIRIEEILSGQRSLLEADSEVEDLAQHYAGRLVMEQKEESGHEPDYTEVDITSLQLLKPRSIGVEHVGLEALRELGLPEILDELGLNRRQQAAVLGLVIGRMAEPGSERSTWHWLTSRSGLGELMDRDFSAMSMMQLYRASDLLVRHRQDIEKGLFSRIRTLFNLEVTVTLYDLTNTFFEGTVSGNDKARRGHSKERRTDCPLVTLGLVVDGSGFVRSSRVFAGNVSEGTTLKVMLDRLKAPKEALVVMDSGIATQVNIDWLVEHGYKYLVVSRERSRCFDDRQAVSVTSATGAAIRIQRVVDDERKEVRLYCHSELRQKKEEGITRRFCERYEQGLENIASGLSKPHCTKKYEKVLERIGRLKEKCRGVGQYYTVYVTRDAGTGHATSLTWSRKSVPGSKHENPGVYCLRTNELNWDEATLWRTYTMLTDLEAVFRSLKSELGLRPVYHHSERRTEGHLFITVLAYQAVQSIRSKLRMHGIYESWSSLRKILSVQRRVTACFKQKDGHTLHVRKSSVPEAALKHIYQCLNLSLTPGGVKKLVH